jgi:Golgi phosphoprotein 3 (GPP34).
MTGVGLAEELLLLGYDDRSGRALGSRIALDLGMAAAVLVELALAGRVALSDGSIVVTNQTPTGDVIADDVLAKIANDTPHTPASWLQRLRHGLRDRILDDLCARGVVRDVAETRLDHIHVHRYPVLDPSVEAEVRARLVDALTGERAPDERTAALAAVMAATRVEPSLGLTGPAAEDARNRLLEIARGAGFADGGIDPEESSVRPSVALVVAALSRAIETALGTRA